MSKPISESLESALRQHWKKVSSKWKKVQQTSSAESVHDLRVGIRRLITLLELSGVLNPSDRDGISGLRKQFKKILKLLGPLRDVQVSQSEFRAMGSQRRFQQFGKYLSQEEKAELKRVLQKLTQARKGKLRDGIRDCIKRSHDLQCPEDEGEIPQKAQKVVRRRAGRLETARRLFRPDSGVSLHKMRIALKKLRYSLESVKELFGVTLLGGLITIDTHQTRMGKLRDLQLLQSRLRRWAGHRKAHELESIRPVLLQLDGKMSKLLAAVKNSHRQLAALPKVLGTKIARQKIRMREIGARIPVH